MMHWNNITQSKNARIARSMIIINTSEVQNLYGEFIGDVGNKADWEKLSFEESRRKKEGSSELCDFNERQYDHTAQSFIWTDHSASLHFNVVPTATGYKKWTCNSRRWKALEQEGFGQVDVRTIQSVSRCRNSSSTSNTSHEIGIDRKAGQTNDIKDNAQIRTRWNKRGSKIKVRSWKCNEKKKPWREDARAKRAVRQQEEEFQSEIRHLRTARATGKRD